MKRNNYVFAVVVALAMIGWIFILSNTVELNKVDGKIDGDFALLALGVPFLIMVFCSMNRRKGHTYSDLHKLRPGYEPLKTDNEGTPPGDD